MFESHAQNGEDIILWRALGHVEHGVYVDVGAADPDDDSVTKAFYERGWSGINVEPAPEHAARLADARPRDTLVQACAGDADGSIVLHNVIGTGLSSVVDDAVDALSDTSYEVVDMTVPVRRLDDILADAGYTPDQAIHFLKIDVEGFEESVIRGIDLSIWRPWVILAESTKPRSTEQAHHDWEPILLEHKYVFCLFDGLNRYYVATEHAELEPSLSFPPSVFDQPYLTPPHAQLLREYENLREGHERLVESYEESLNGYRQRGVELDRTLTAYGELETEHNRIVDSWQTLEAQYNDVVAEWKRVEEERKRFVALSTTVIAERDEASAECRTLRDGIARMGAEFDQIRGDRDAARLELELTRQTLSWRVTRPLRAVRGFRGA